MAVEENGEAPRKVEESVEEHRKMVEGSGPGPHTVVEVSEGGRHMAAEVGIGLGAGTVPGEVPRRTAVVVAGILDTALVGVLRRAVVAVVEGIHDVALVVGLVELHTLAVVVVRPADNLLAEDTALEAGSHHRLGSKTCVPGSWVSRLDAKSMLANFLRSMKRVKMGRLI